MILIGEVKSGHERFQSAAARISRKPRKHMTDHAYDALAAEFIYAAWDLVRKQQGLIAALLEERERYFLL